jgi:hypothetical protein
MNVSNGGCCARKEEGYCMDASVVDDVVTYGSHPYKRKQHKDEMLHKRLVKEAWELLVIPTNQVASNSFNGNYAGMNFMYLCCIIVEGN